jgi:hypothetical protein
VKHDQEGGSNTKYFHFIANIKHKKEKIFQLEQDEETTVCVCGRGRLIQKS